MRRVFRIIVICVISLLLGAVIQEKLGGFIGVGVASGICIAFYEFWIGPERE